MQKNDSPCHGRTPTCKFDGTCDQYSKWHEQHVAKQREIRSKGEAENMTNSFYIESGIRIKKEKRR